MREANASDEDQAMQAAEAEILASLKDGAQCQSGIVVAAVKSFERKTVAWKEKFVEFVDEIRGKGEGAPIARAATCSARPLAAKVSSTPPMPPGALPLLSSALTTSLLWAWPP